MLKRRERRAFAIRRPLEESRGGWALFGRLLLWSTRNNRGPSSGLSAES